MSVDALVRGAGPVGCALAAVLRDSLTVRILERSGKSFEFPVRWGAELQSEHERYLAEEHVGRPLFVTDYPAEIKAILACPWVERRIAVDY